MSRRPNEWGGTKDTHLSNTVIFVPPVYVRRFSCIRLPDQVFKVAYEQTSTAEAHFGAHGNTADLVKVLTVKIKGDKGEYNFCKAYKSRMVSARLILLPRKNWIAIKPSEIGWICKQITHPNGKIEGSAGVESLSLCVGSTLFWLWKSYCRRDGNSGGGRICRQVNALEPNFFMRTRSSNEKGRFSGMQTIWVIIWGGWRGDFGGEWSWRWFVMVVRKEYTCWLMVWSTCNTSASWLI